MYKKIIFTMVFVCVSVILFAQSVYQLQYKQLINEDTIDTYALFFQNENGSGFLRTRYLDKETNEQMILQFALDEQPIMMADSSWDTSKMYVMAIQPELIIGNVDAKRNFPIFLFEKNTENNNELELKSLMKKNNQDEIIKDEIAQATIQYIDANLMTRQLFENYFQPDDYFLENFFNSNTKDLGLPDKNTTLYLIVVANTLEEKIGSSCAKDLERIEDTYKTISNYLGCRINVREVSGKNFNKRNVVSELKLLNPTSNDIVVFYYTGHGYRKESDKRRYPYLDLRSNPYQDYLIETLNMEDIYNLIKTKHAKTNIVMSDCCNSYVEVNNAEGFAPFSKKSLMSPLDVAAIRTLFLGVNHLSILATAADSTQRAASNLQFGGFFSYFFKMNLESYTSKSKVASIANYVPSWFDIFKSTQTQTIEKAQNTYCEKPFIPANICNQTPCYRIER